MIKIKFCGLTRTEDIEIVNRLKPDYIGFVFYPPSKRNVSSGTAEKLKSKLSKDIQAVGVFVDEPPESIANLLDKNIIDVAQLHGNEDEEYIAKLRSLTSKPIIKAFRIDSIADVQKAEKSTADYVLLDSGDGGTGTRFDWNLLSQIKRQYFLAGGLNVSNICQIEKYRPYAVDVSSGIETDSVKDESKMTAFMNSVRNMKGRNDYD